MKQHILFIGNLSPYSRSYQRYCAFQDMEYPVTGISLLPTDYIPRVSHKGILFDRIRFKLGFPTDNSGVNGTIRTYVRNHSCPDLVWIENGGLLQPKTLHTIRQHWPDVTTLLYSNDNLAKRHNRTVWMRKNIQLVDVIFIVKGYSDEAMYRMGAKRVLFCHRGYDRISIPPRDSTTPFEYDVTFVGSYEQARYDVIRSLAENGIQITVYGNNWPSALVENLDIRLKPVFGEDFVKILHRSKIVLNFLRKINDDITTGRTFEIPGSGSFMLAERTDEQKEYFTEGQEAEFFGDLGELIDKIRYYLIHQQERIRIAENGLRRCQESGYSFHDRLPEMLSALD